MKTRPRKTVEDYLQLPEDVRAELIDGELYVTPAPTSRHQEIVGNVYAMVREFARRGAGKAFVAPVDVLLASGEVVQPDVLFVSTARLAIVTESVRGAPDLVIEVISSTSQERDRIVKRGLYARGGVSEYWLVEEATRSVEVLVLDGQAYRAHGFFEIEDIVTSPALEGLEVAVADVFE